MLRLVLDVVKVTPMTADKRIVQYVPVRLVLPHGAQDVQVVRKEDGLRGPGEVSRQHRKQEYDGNAEPEVGRAKEEVRIAAAELVSCVPATKSRL